MTKLTLNPETGSVFSGAQLREVFELVCGRENWKAEIDATVGCPVNVTEPIFVEMIQDAVIFFTGSIPTVIKNDAGEFKVRAVGYHRATG